MMDCTKCGFPMTYTDDAGGYVCGNRGCPSTRVEAAPVTQSPAPPGTNQIPLENLYPELRANRGFVDAHRLDDRTLLALMSAILDKPEHPLNWATDRAQDLLNEVNKHAQ